MEKKTKATSAPKKARARHARKGAVAKKASAFDRGPAETIRIPPEDVENLEALRLFAKAYEKL
jgi:hypothetical protein